MYLASGRTRTRHSVRAGKRQAGFTLVELLVVIGIITVLIAMLLPVLGKVQQQATSLKCMSNLRSIGQALIMYADQNKGILPYGGWDGTCNTNVIPYTDSGGSNGAAAGDWTMKLYAIMNPNAGDTWNDQYSAKSLGNSGRNIFLCPDAPDQVIPSSQAITSYGCHPRIMPDLAYWYGSAHDYTSGSGTDYLKPYKWAHILRSSEICIIMDASVTAIPGGGWSVCGQGMPTVIGLDSASLVNQFGQYNTCLTDYYTGTAYTPADSPNIGGNVDNPQYGMADIRFRHMNNTVMNSLMADGHVQSFHLKHASTYSGYQTDLTRGNIDPNE